MRAGWKRKRGREEESRGNYLGAASLEYTMAREEARRIVQYNTCATMIKPSC
jgi:hypothetical protein